MFSPGAYLNMSSFRVLPTFNPHDIEVAEKILPEKRLVMYAPIMSIFG